jgi:hypothetical protein
MWKTTSSGKTISRKHIWKLCTAVLQSRSRKGAPRSPIIYFSVVGAGVAYLSLPGSGARSRAESGDGSEAASKRFSTESLIYLMSSTSSLEQIIQHPKNFKGKVSKNSYIFQQL